MIVAQVEAFLLTHCSLSEPLLLALSGGPDSLSLFYALLSFREKHQTPFHVAHVDHGWRKESQEEAKLLQQLALFHQVPFHLKELNPFLLSGNLESACREERYAFFSELNQQIPFQAVLTAHHQDDQAETIFKRVLEGAHWTSWIGLQSETSIKSVRILRPLLGIEKNEILKMLSENKIEAFQDPSNFDPKFLRSRLRQTIFPRLHEEFGKHVQHHFIAIGREAEELRNYFDEHLAFLLENMIEGPWGGCLDLQQNFPKNFLEIKYLLRLLCKKKGIFSFS